MSLIHDALRRADDEKQQREAGAEPAAPPPLPPKETDPTPPPPRRRSPWTALLGVALVILVGVMACGLWWGIGAVREQAGAAVESASAALEQAAARSRTSAEPVVDTSADTPQALAAKASEETDPPAEDAALETASAGAAPAGKAENDQPAEAGTDAPERLEERIEPILSAIGGSEGMPTADPSLLSATISPIPLLPENRAPAGQSETPPAPDGPEEEGAAHAPSEPPASSNPPAEPETPPANPKPTKTEPPAAKSAPSPAEPEPPPAKPESPPSEPEPPAAKPKPPAPPPPVDTSHLKVSSIMLGPSGGLAVINGRPVREGESVAGAKVLHIRSRTVEVEIDGRRATVGM